MSQRRLTKADLVDRFGESSKQIERYVAEGIPCEGTGAARRFLWPECRNWRDERVRKLERDKVQRDEPMDFEKSRARKMDAEAREAELRVEKMLGNVVPLDMVTEVAGRIGDRLLASIQNLPANYGLRLEECGVPAAKAEAVLEAIATELTTTLRDAVDGGDEAEEAEEADEHRGVA